MTFIDVSILLLKENFKKINADGVLLELKNQLGNKLLKLFYERGLFLFFYSSL